MQYGAGIGMILRSVWRAPDWQLEMALATEVMAGPDWLELARA